MTFASNIKLIILFGSQATGMAGKNSDTDVAVLADHALTFAEKGEVGLEAAKMLRVSEDRVDVVDIWRASPLLQQEIARSGKLLYGAPFDFVRFRVLAWKRYQDTAKFRRSREQAFMNYYGK